MAEKLAARASVSSKVLGPLSTSAEEEEISADERTFPILKSTWNWKSFCAHYNNKMAICITVQFNCNTLHDNKTIHSKAIHV